MQCMVTRVFLAKVTDSPKKNDGLVSIVMHTVISICSSMADREGMVMRDAPLGGGGGVDGDKRSV